MSTSQTEKQLRPDYLKLPDSEWTPDEIKDRISILQKVAAKREAAEPAAVQEHTHFCLTSPIAHSPNVHCYCPCHGPTEQAEQPEPIEECLTCLGGGAVPATDSIEEHAGRVCPDCDGSGIAGTRLSGQPTGPSSRFHTQALAIVKRHFAKADVDEALVRDIVREMEMASVRQPAESAKPDLAQPWWVDWDDHSMEPLLAVLTDRGGQPSNLIGYVKWAEVDSAQPPIAPDVPQERRVHSVMTPEEYLAFKIEGWHEVDGFGNVGVRYLGIPDAPGEQAAPVAEAPQRQATGAYVEVLHGTCTLGYADCSLVEFAQGLKYFIEEESRKPNGDTHLIHTLQRAACIGWELARRGDKTDHEAGNRGRGSG